MFSVQWPQCIPTVGEESDIIFMKFATTDEAARLTSKSRNLPKSNQREAPRIIMHMDNQAQARYRAFQNVARTLRLESKGQIQTLIQSGKYDFLL